MSTGTDIVDQKNEQVAHAFYIPTVGSRSLDDAEPIGVLLEQAGLVIDPTTTPSGTLAIWDLNQGELVAYLPIPVWDLSVSPTQTHVAIKTQAEVQLWTLDELLDLGIMVEPRRWQ